MASNGYLLAPAFLDWALHTVKYTFNYPVDRWICNATGQQLTCDQLFEEYMETVVKKR